MHVGLLHIGTPSPSDAIGVYTERMSAALREWFETTIITSGKRGGWAGSHSNVAHVQEGLEDLDEVLSQRKVDVLLVQYNPFLFAPRGLAFDLPGKLRLNHPCRLILVTHERWSEPDSLRLRLLGMAHRTVLRSLLRVVDDVIVCTEGWIPWIEARFSGRVHYIPVGDNVGSGKEDEEGLSALAAPDYPRPWIGTFGKPHNSRLETWVERTILEIGGTRVHVGSGVDVTSVPYPCVAPGVIRDDQVENHLRAVDLFLCPFRRGVSGRRGSFMTALHLGLPILTTMGIDTGPSLRSLAGSAFAASEDDAEEDYLRFAKELLADPDKRRSLSERARDAYNQKFDWPVIARRLHHFLVTNAPA
ncbi:MAG: glycosyltransferase involved in cell wall biosynthesis [Rhodothermales bacterium]|jgi:glycosyltransferase involved in cell wall biosynthesis